MEESYLQNSFGEACFLSKLFEVLGIWVVVDGKVGFHGPELVVLEGSPHALGLLGGRIRLLIPVQVVSLVLITTCHGNSQETRAQRKLRLLQQSDHDKGCGPNLGWYTDEKKEVHGQSQWSKAVTVHITEVYVMEALLNKASLIPEKHLGK